MRVCGLTGGIACGKSVVSRWLEEEGYVVIDLDRIVKELQKPNSSTTKKIGQAFPGVVSADGFLDREKLGAIVFEDVNKRRKLNSLMRAPIAFALFKRLMWHWCIATGVLILDAPLLFETKLDLICAWTVVINTPEEKQIQRILKRDNVTEEEARQRIRAQMPLATKCKRARLVIENSGDNLSVFTNSLSRLLLPRLKRHKVLFFAPWRLNSLPGFLLLMSAISFLLFRS